MDDIAKAYTVLELEPGASLPDVNQAYKDLVFIWHPDRIPADNTRLRDKAQDKLKRLNDARSRLKQYLRNGTKTPSKGAAKTSSYNPERYGSSRYRAYSQNRYTRPYGATNGNGATRNGASTGSTATSTENGSTGSTNGNGGARNAASQNNGRSAGYGANYYSAGASSGPAKDAPTSPTAANNDATVSPTNGSVSANNSAANGSAAKHSSGNGHTAYGAARRNAAAYSSTYRPVSDNSYADYIYRPPQSAAYYPAPTPPSRKKNDPDLEGSDFKGANLKEKDFSGRNLSKSNLEGADLSDAFLHKVNLNRANLHKAKLFRANLLQANLSHANLREANLVGADLSGADLSGADLSGAIVGYGDKIMVKLTAARLTGTIMPNGNIHE